ncbi:hypothetical protein DRO64_03410 [Candidatus Bathyarchaeota archaeon]|nr:MAG: hypothetical protein DRO64_03410 [Candidatus Bathyarchaeota archaeon]
MLWAAAEDDKNNMIMHLGSAKPPSHAANECLQGVIEYLKKPGVADEKPPRLDPEQMEEPRKCDV